MVVPDNGGDVVLRPADTPRPLRSISAMTVLPVALAEFRRPGSGAGGLPALAMLLHLRANPGTARGTGEVPWARRADARARDRPTTRTPTPARSERHRPSPHGRKAGNVVKSSGVA